ncbi:MAG: hypothetical protein R3B82_18370 [Sandaracinaceae bacterium]
MLRLTAAVLALFAYACSEGEEHTRPVDPNAFVLAPGFAPDPQIKTGMAGGPVEAAQWSPDCRGWVQAQPSHTLVLDESIPHLRVVVFSSGDPTLIVRMADGSYRCNDDHEGLNSMVEGPFGAGTHQVFVGSYGSGPPIPYAIGVSRSVSLQPSAIASHVPAAPPPPPPPPPSVPTPPTPSMPPPGVPSGPQPEVVLSGGVRPDPVVQASWAGGPVVGAQVGEGCVGFYPTRAQHAITLRGPLESLRLLVSATVDTTMAVRGPDGAVRCNDDSDGLNPSITGPFMAGRHEVLIGTYGGGGGGEYRLAITTDASLTAATLATLTPEGAQIAPLPSTPRPPMVDPPDVRQVPGALPGDMSPEGLTPAQRAAADAAGISYYEARELHRCDACMQRQGFDECIMICREPCLSCVTSGPATEGRCGPPCGGRR